MEEGPCVGGEEGMGRLPEACISHVLALTSPVDSCRSAAVSAAFRSAVDSDTVWGRFLPPDYREILARAVEQVECSSKRELYFRLCDPILIDGGKMSFQLEKSSGAKWFMIAARELAIVWGDTPQYWKWVPAYRTRFEEVAQLLNVCWLEIHGKIESRMLSPRTNYAAYLVFKLDEECRGFSAPVQEASVSIGGRESKHIVRVQPGEAREFRRFPPLYRRFFRGMVNFVPAVEADDEQGGAKLPATRADGWMEVEMGEFYNEDGEDGVVDLRLMEVRGGHWKSGLTVLGIEVRPKKK